MPCRALEAFRHIPLQLGEVPGSNGLNALSGIGGVQTSAPATASDSASDSVLMPCRALEAFRLCGRGRRPQF